MWYLEQALNKRNKVSFKGTGQLLDLGPSESLPSGSTPCYNLISMAVSALSGNNWKQSPNQKNYFCGIINADISENVGTWSTNKCIFRNT